MGVWFSLLRDESGVTVMELTGRLSMPGIAVAELERTIQTQIERGARKLVLDLRNVEYVDTSGVGMLAVCAGAMGKVGGKIVIAGAHGRVEEVVLLTHLHRIMGIYSDRPAACAALAELPPPPATAWLQSTFKPPLTSYLARAFSEKLEPTPPRAGHQ